MNALLSTLGLSTDARDARKAWIGGSDANTILSGNADRIIRLWREKRGEAEPEDLSDNLAVQMGSFSEPLNVAWYEKHTGDLVTDRNALVLHPTIQRMAANLDGLCSGGERVFEAKHCGVRNTDAELWARYLPQLCHNTLCAGVSGAVLSCFKGNGDWMMLEYEHDDGYAAALLEAEAAFWRCVETGEPPAPLPLPPAPKPKGVVEYDMSASNAWAVLAAEYVETMLPAQRHEQAKKDLKALVPDDASKCFGHNLTIKRDARGALRFTAGV